MNGTGVHDFFTSLFDEALDGMYMQSLDELNSGSTPSIMVDIIKARLAHISKEDLAV